MYGLARSMTIAAAVWSMVLGYADLESRRGGRSDVARAIGAAPLDAGYLAQQSLLTEDPAEAAWLLRESVRSNPWYAWSWIHLGLIAETSGNNVEARRDLIQAALVDRGFAPRWAMCNYFFRTGDTDSFWYWSKQALAVTETDFVPVLRLAWRFSPDVQTILRRAIPARDPVKRAFLMFLIREHPLDTGFSEAMGLFSTALPDDVPAADEFMRKLVNAGKTDEAVQTWNALCARKLLPLPQIRPSGAPVLMNARFGTAPSARTFDWRLMTTDGIAAESRAASGELEIAAAGRQPEHWGILSQWIPVQTGRHYEFRFKTRISNAERMSGLRWEIYDGSTPGKTLARSEDFGLVRGDDAIRFFANSSLVTLTLNYDRPRGTTNFEGTATISNLSLSETGNP
jgi:hypothetical protein